MSASRSSSSFGGSYFVSRKHRRGFTLVELSIAAALTGLLLIMISGLWSGFGRSLADTIAQARVVSEAEMALQSIRRDMRGWLPGSELGELPEGKLVGRLVSGGNRLLLCFDGRPTNGAADWTSPDRVLRYELRDGKLLRVDQTSGASFVVADHVRDVKITDQGTATRFDLELGYRDFVRRYTFLVQDPS